MSIVIKQGMVVEHDDRKCTWCRQRADTHIWKCTDCGQIADGELKPAGEPQCVCGSLMVAAHCRTWPGSLFMPSESGGCVERG